jgi:hypothetical protein
MQNFVSHFKNTGEEGTTAPLKHALSRERKVRRDTQRGTGVSKRSNLKKSNPQSVRPAQRVREYLSQPFSVQLDTMGGAVLWCDTCGEAVGTKKSVINRHVVANKHMNGLNKKTKLAAGFIHHYVVCKDADRKNQGESFTVPVDVSNRRMRMAYAFLQDGIPFEVFNNPVHPLGLRAVMQEQGSCSFPYREMRDHIRDILEMNIKQLEQELQDVRLSFIFDGTPHVAEVFGIIFRFWKNDKITHRLVQLKFYDGSFDQKQLAHAIVDCLQNFTHRQNVRAAICDGCPVNQAALVRLENIYSDIADPVCISHSSNVVGKIFLDVLPLAKTFQEKWSQMMSTSDTAKRLFRGLAHQAPVGSSEIRWYSWLENIKQIFLQSAAVNAVVHDEGSFSEALRGSMKTMLANEQSRNDLRCQMAAAVDAGEHLVNICYKQEGDDEFLCTESYNHWHVVLERLREITSEITSVNRLREVLPNVTSVVATIVNNQHAQNAMIREVALKLLPVYNKMFFDTNNRLARTFRIYQACRFFHYHLIAGHNLLTLQDELTHILNLQICYTTGEERYLNELQTYKAVADLEMRKPKDDQPDVSTFWLRYALRMPIFFLASRDVGLIAPSSGTIERAFSLLTQGFTDQQEGALEDYKTASVMIRYNNIWKDRDNAV